MLYFGFNALIVRCAQLFLLLKTKSTGKIKQKPQLVHNTVLSPTYLRIYYPAESTFQQVFTAARIYFLRLICIHNILPSRKYFSTGFYRRRIYFLRSFSWFCAQPSHEISTPVIVAILGWVAVEDCVPASLQRGEKKSYLQLLLVIHRYNKILKHAVYVSLEI